MKNKIKEIIKKLNFKNTNNKSSNECVILNEDLLKNKKFLNLPSSAKVLYAYMQLSALGKEEFYYAESSSSKFMSKMTFYSSRNKLIESGFIEMVETNKSAHIPNKYRFSSKWKEIAN